MEEWTVSFGVLVLENVQLEDSGTYRCSMSNSVGHSHYDVRLEVVEPLRIEILPKDPVINQGQSLTLRCSFNRPQHTAGSGASGGSSGSGSGANQQQSTLKWYKDGVAITYRDKYQPVDKVSLRINNMQRVDQGVYQCFVFTERQSAQASTRLQLGGQCSTFLLHSMQTCH